MEKRQFEHMIETSGLRHILTMRFQLRFLVSLNITGRIQCDTLAFGRQEFELMDEDQARVHIDACKARLARAAKTQQGVVVYSDPQPVAQTKPKIPVAASTMAINYPAH